MGNAWPSAIEYRDALQHPDKAFRDPALKGCRAETNRLDVPRARAGAFANVYKMMNGSTAHKAVRVFLFPGAERQERYQAVSDHLRRCRPKAMVEFKYDPQGIRLNHEWYPILTMDWVAGLSLGEWVRECVQRRDSQRFAKMAERWVELLEDLKRAEIAHGDLQHDNVMVVNEVPFLVDYDCMCVPRLVGRRALEEGKPAYQHPTRGQQDLSLHLDHFSAWIILIALRALAADLSLYERYNERLNNENLLFSEKDIKEPARSPLWQELLSFRDSEVKDWARQLRDTLPNKPFDSIPPFELNPFAALRKQLQWTPRKWEQIGDLAAKLSGKPLPPDLVAIVDEARRRTTCRTAVERALAARSLRQLDGAYHPSLLDDWADCAALLPRAREAKSLLAVVGQLEAALRNVGDGRQFVALWAQHAAKLKDAVEAQALGQAASTWMRRLEACDAFRVLLKQPTASERVLADAWVRLVQTGGHPAADLHRSRGEQARVRAELLDRLRAIPATETEINDQQFAQLWSDPLLTGCHEANALRPRLDVARLRLQRAEELRKVIGQATGDVTNERLVVEAASKLPANYGSALTARAQTAGTRVARAADLAQALAATVPFDMAIADAWEKVQKLGLAPCPAATANRCALAVRRRDCLRKVKAIDAMLPPDEQDQQWLQYWDAALLAGSNDARPFQDRFTAASERSQLLTALKQAVDDANRSTGKEELVLQLAAKLPDGYPRNHLERIKQANVRVTVRKALREALAAVPQRDRGIATAWIKARNAGGLRATKTIFERCELAVRRSECLRKLEKIQTTLPLDEQDAGWLRDCDEPLLRDCHDAAAALARYRLARERTQLWQTLSDCLGNQDLARVRVLARHRLMADYPPALRQRAEIDQLLQQADHFDRILQVLQPGQGCALTGEDLRFVRANPKLFQSQRGQIEKLLSDWLANEVRLQPGDPQWEMTAEGGVKVRWTWPQFGRVNYCRMAADPGRFLPLPADAKQGAVTVTVEEHRRCGGGMPLLLLGSRGRLYVTIWPALDLGWAELLGRPLEIGPIHLGSPHGPP